MINRQKEFQLHTSQSGTESLNYLSFVCLMRPALTPIIYNQYIFKPGMQNLAKAFVIRMGQVGRPVLLGRKRQDKAMGKTLVNTFR